MPAGVVVADAATGCVAVSNAWAGLPWNEEWSEVELHAPNVRSGAGPLGYLLDRALGGEAVRGVELRRTSPGGRTAWVRVNAAPVRGPQGEVVCAVLVLDDVTTEKEAEAILQASKAELETRVDEQGVELSRTAESLEAEARKRQQAERNRQQLVARLTTITEDERRRISRELHDETSQHLASLIVGLKTVRGQLGAEEPPARVLDELQKQAEQIDRSVHRIAWELRPAALDQMGLEAALRSWLDHWSGLARIPADLHCNLGPTRLPPELEAQLYRLITEALANVQKHSQAKRASVLLARRQDHIIAAVEDDGRGFDLELIHTQGSSRGLGLLGMQERAQLLGGVLHIESSPGHGTTVLARVPHSPLTEDRP
jgi:signal transduction histidine kinase